MKIVPKKENPKAPSTHNFYLRSRLANMKTVFLTWSQTVTYHCFPKIFKPKTHVLMQCVWAVVFLTFSSLTCLILVNIVTGFYQFSVVTQIELIDEKPTFFPAVTICNSNPFTTKLAENLTKKVSIEMYGIDLESISFSEFINYAYASLAFSVKSYASSPEYIVNRKLLGNDLREIITHCTFNAAPCNLSHDFRWFYHYDYGNCLQMNADVSNVKRIVLGQKVNGLSLMLGPLVTQNAFPIIVSEGLRILVHNQTHEPNTFDSFVSVEPGKETNIAIGRTFFANTPSPYSTCTDLANGFDSALYNHMIHSNKSYAQADCLNLYFQQLLMDKCACYSSALPTLVASSSPCLNSTQFKCYNDLYSGVLTQQISVTGGLLQCPLECDFMTYGTFLSGLSLPNKETYNLFKSDQALYHATQTTYDVDLSTYDLFKQHFYSINVYYEATHYTFISGTPQMTTYQLISSLGGSLGMLLGFSAFSLLEFFEMLCKIVWIGIFSKR